ETPCFVVDEGLLTENLKRLKYVSDKSGCRILLAQKAFALYPLYPLIAEYLDGATSSGLFEARLAYEEMRAKSGKRPEYHIFAPAYAENEIDEIISLTDHMVFNSAAQLKKYGSKVKAGGKSFGIRINPEFSTQNRAIYDPCAPFSRLGIRADELKSMDTEGIDGLHFHTMCEQRFADLDATFTAVEKKFEPYLKRIKWVNFGGGQHITADGYDVEGLIALIGRVSEKYGVQIYLEPGEAVALNAGFLVSSVLDTIKNDMDIAIIDASAACHMPDVMEMPYRPNIISAGKPREKKYTYRLGGNTCLAGDIIGDYSFDKPLKAGDKLIFCDMAHYSMVKTNMFNGINLPSIAVRGINGKINVLKKFSYADYKTRIG
ncbi:MAG: carboxynorspermidine decarboxylase, partial [Clostridiales bacterium]|nr:carboxynorspermidine decarboxylase [Clostridiales bacterium]